MSVRPGAWTGRAAALTAFLFAAVSLYWATGGTAGLDTLGGTIEERARAGDPVIMRANWAAVVLKILGGVLALALVQPWGRRLPRRVMLAAAWTGAAVLILYGTVQTAGVALVALDVIQVTEPIEPTALRWRLFLWEPWFLLWGLLLAAAAWHATQATATSGGGGRKVPQRPCAEEPPPSTPPHRW